MGSQSPALEKLFDEWAKKHEANLSQEEPYLMPHEPPYGAFVRDGVVNMDVWKKQKIRICFVLSEASGYTDREVYPEGHDVAAEWNEKGSFSTFLFKLVVWTKAVQDAFAAPTTYCKKDIFEIKDDIIRSIAIVNIKKSDGQKRPVYEETRKFAYADAAEIRQELELIKANVILCCNNFHLLHGKHNKELEDKRDFVFYNNELRKVAKFAYAWENRLLLHLWTPANFVGTLKSNTINYYALRGICRAAFKGFTAKQQQRKQRQQQKQSEAQQQQQQ